LTASTYILYYCPENETRQPERFKWSKKQKFEEKELAEAIISELSRSLIEIAWHFGPKGLRGECCNDLTMPEFIALEKVSTTPDCPVQVVGHSLGFTKSGATRIVNRLEQKGFIDKIKSPQDARICCVVITEKGERILRLADSRYMKQFKELLMKMPPKTASEVIRTITGVARALKE
jgi:DNA-binding MarR family transcriptional regulator